MSALYVNAGLVPMPKRFPNTFKNSWIIRNESCSDHYPSNSNKIQLCYKMYFIK